MESESTTTVLDAGDGYFFEKIHVEQSLLKSLLSGLRVSRSNFDQVSRAYDSIMEMEAKCRDQLERVNDTPAHDIVGKLASINLCEDMLRSADKEVAVVKTIMSRTDGLVQQVEDSLSKYDSSRANLTDIEESKSDDRVTEILKSTDEVASELRSELASVRQTSNDIMSKCAQRISVRNQLFNDIRIAKEQLGWRH